MVVRVRDAGRTLKACVRTPIACTWVAGGSDAKVQEEGYFVVHGTAHTNGQASFMLG